MCVCVCLCVCNELGKILKRERERESEKLRKGKEEGDILVNEYTQCTCVCVCLLLSLSLSLSLPPSPYLLAYDSDWFIPSSSLYFINILQHCEYARYCTGHIVFPPFSKIIECDHKTNRLELQKEFTWL